jgi:hypothetical protein
MTTTRNLHTTSPRQRQIGRKVLQADRLATVITRTAGNQQKKSWRMPTVRPRIIGAICAALIVIGVTSFIGLQSYMGKVAATQKITAEKQQRVLEAKGIAADACRRKKVEEKAALIGKITYDELYDHNSCDK